MIWHRADPGLNLALGQMAMPDQPPVASSIGLVSVAGKKRVQFSLHGLRDQLARTIAQQIRQRVG